MKKFIWLICLIVLALNSSAQDLKDLENLSKLTDSEKAYKSTDTPVKTTHNFDHDWDVVGVSTLEVDYCYTKHFPLTVDVKYTICCFVVGAEIGANFDKNVIVKSDLEYHDPFGLAMVILGGYSKYLSFNIGAGVCALNHYKTETTTQNNNVSTGTGIEISTSASTSVTKNTLSCALALKPSITGHIPLGSDEYFLTLNVGYLFIPKYDTLNGVSLGIGFQFEL